MNSLFDKESLEQMKVIGIFGNTGSGKTALAFKFLEKFGEFYDNIYVVNHPAPQLIKQLNYKNLRGIGAIERLNDCVVFLDEPQLILNSKDYKNSMVFAKLCSIARQKNIKLILSTSDTRVFSTQVESYIDTWIVKDVDYSMTKQRSKIRKIIVDNSFISPTTFQLDNDEFMFENRTLSEFNGYNIFELPSFWSNNLSCAYGVKRNSIKTVNKAIILSDKSHLSLEVKNE